MYGRDEDSDRLQRPPPSLTPVPCTLHKDTVSGCTCTKQTFWTEDQFVVTASSGIRDRDTRVAEIVARELQKAKPGKWGCVQARELWSPKEETHVRPGRASWTYLVAEVWEG